MIIIWQFSSVKSFSRISATKGKKNEEKNKTKRNKPKNNKVNIVDFCIDIIFATSLKTERSYWKVYYVIFEKRVRVFYRGFHTRENWWKREAVRPKAFIVFGCLETPVKHEARVFEMASQSAPNCKQKKKRKPKNKKSKNHINMWFLPSFV